MKLSYLSKTLTFALLISSFAMAAVTDADRGEWNQARVENDRMGRSIEQDRAFYRGHRHAISIDPISWVGGNFRLQYEMSLNDRVAFNMPLNFGFKEVIANNGFFRGAYFAPKFGVKYYVTGRSTYQGFYLNPLLGFFVGKLDVPAGAPAGLKIDATAGLSYGFRMGYAWNIWRGFWLDSYLGYENLAVSFNSKDNTNYNNSLALQNIPSEGAFGFTAAILLGYNF
ncbi:MAG: hypothetical protein V4534_08660 [Myxococcota bacterium]